MVNTNKFLKILFLLAVTSFCILWLLTEKNIYETFKNTDSVFRSLKLNDVEVREYNACGLKSINKKYYVKKKKIICKNHVPSKASCRYVNETYAYDVNNSCNGKHSIEICKFVEKKLYCKKDACENQPVTIRYLNPNSGEVVSMEEKYDTLQNLTSLVLKYAEKSSKNGFHFLFLSCGNNKTKTQLLILENNIFENTLLNTNQKQKININLVMLDSISRPHFYRSLQKTIKTINKINLESDSEVLDFEMFQAVHGHTLENSRALFTGAPFPTNFTGKMQLNTGVGIKTFMSHFKKFGYLTLYQDDMCWKSFWGIRMDMGKPYGGWADLTKKIQKSSIQYTGLLQSSCEILSSLGLSTVFQTQKHEKVCYNSKQQNYYYLKYLEHFYNNLPENQNAVSFTALNVAHDSYGIRVQAIDEDLSEFLKEMSKLKNTLTIIFSDHGNTYTRFVSSYIEGRFEMFHPSMFILIPKNVQNYIGLEELQNLRVNQNRLFTIVDVHKMLFYFAEKNDNNNADNLFEKGLLKRISENRNCDDLPLRMPNICICQNTYSKGKNDSNALMYLEFALGKLNNIITNSSQNCKRLTPLWFEIFSQVKNGEFTLTNFDIYTLPGVGSTNDVEKINVVVKSTLNEFSENFGLELVAWDRISEFNGYRKCSNAEFSFRLCVCDLINSSSTSRFDTKKLYNTTRTSVAYTLSSYIVSEEVIVLKQKSLFLIVRTFKESIKNIGQFLVAVTFEVESVSTESYFVNINLKSVYNLKPVLNSNCQGIVSKASVTYLCTYSVIWTHIDARFHYNAHYNKV
ncbi:uncharacterized protein LOC124816454 [Hydra vulgaris]|uniref:uncharacterized protein LOC124816454 n=1 Tax=Hydra vulgaris TaxID=6087 RepID=UPI001F5FA2EA|nr:uncharacterized protein LOC124816454 [Hydra vulgaris]